MKRETSMKGSMKTAVLHAPAQIRCEEVPIPAPREGWVLIRVKTCGVCGSDIPRVMEKGTYRFPMIPGHEFCGEVVKLGAATGNDLMGARVTVVPLIPCGTCARWSAGSSVRETSCPIGCPSIGSLKRFR